MAPFIAHVDLSLPRPRAKEDIISLGHISLRHLSSQFARLYVQILLAQMNHRFSAPCRGRSLLASIAHDFIAHASGGMCQMKRGNDP
jgi:hypothetical protein